MEINNYLNNSTLKLFLYLLYQKNSFLLSDFEDKERQGITKGIFFYNLENLFVFKNADDILENPTEETISEILYKTLEIMLPDSNKEKLLNFINKYVDNYKIGNLISSDNIYYPYNISYRVFMKFLKNNKVYGQRINRIIPLYENSREASYNKKVRLLDMIFYFLKEKYIDINISKVEKVLYKVIDDYWEEEARFSITIILNKTVDEISNIEGAWISYGYDLRLNLLEHIAYNKDNYCKFQSDETKLFNFFKILIESKGKPILIVKAYSELYPEDKRPDNQDFPTKKNQINSQIKNLRKKLKIKQGSNSAARIAVSGKEISLISNI